MSGAVSYHAGLSAEKVVAQHYVDSGYQIVAQRFRGKAGEIDLIAERCGWVVFIEVKKSKTHAAAAEKLSERQRARIYASASEYLATKARGQDSNARFDVALVDSAGRIEVLENAFAG